MQQNEDGKRATPVYRAKHEAALKTALENPGPAADTLPGTSRASSSQQAGKRGPSSDTEIQHSAAKIAKPHSSSGAALERTAIERQNIDVAYHYTSNKNYAAMSAGGEGTSNLIKFSSTDPLGNKSAKYNYTVYFTDIPPAQMRDIRHPERVISVFGKTHMGQPRWNFVEKAYKLNLKALPEEAIIYKEKDHVFTIDMAGAKKPGIGLTMKQSLYRTGESLVPDKAERRRRDTVEVASSTLANRHAWYTH